MEKMDMKFFVIVILIFSIVAFNGCRPRNQAVTETAVGFGNMQNPHYGKTTNEIPELAGGSLIGGMLLDCGNFSFEVFNDINEDRIYVFLNDANRILDTINLGKLNDNEFSTALYFLKDGEHDSELFGIITNVSYDWDNWITYGEISRVWRANRNTGIISPEDITGLGYSPESGSFLPPRTGTSTLDESVRNGMENESSDFSIIGSWSYLSNGFTIVQNFSKDGSWSEGISGSNLFSRGSWALDGNVITISSYSLFDDNGDWKVDFDPNDVTLSTAELTFLNRNVISLKYENGHEGTLTRYQW